LFYFVVGAIFGAVIYIPLRYIRNLWEKEEAPGWSSIVASLLAWLTVAGFGLMVYGFVDLCISIYAKPKYSYGFEFSALVLGGLLLYYLNQINPEFLDLSHMVPFLRLTLRFRNIAGRRMVLDEELDRFEVRRVYKETTGKELQEEKKPKPRYKRSDREIQKQVKALLKQQLAAPRLEQELTALNKGGPVDISDSWKINTMRSAPHSFFEQVKRVQVDSQSRRMLIHVEFRDVDSSSFGSSRGIFSFYQDLIEFLHASVTVNWMLPYVPYFDKILLHGSRTDMDDHSVLQTFVFLKLEVAVRHLQVPEGKFLNPTELPVMASVQFNRGKAIE
jgi:hypothetical protein